MKDFNVPILGFDRYNFNLETQLITNKWDNVIKIREDIRGQLVTNLLDNEGIQRTLSFNKLRRNVLNSLTFKSVSETRKVRVLMSYIEHKDNKLTLQEMSKKIHSYCADLDILEIGIILTNIH